MSYFAISSLACVKNIEIMTTLPSVMSDTDIDNLGEKFRKGMDIKDRKYLGKVYPQCFVGTYFEDNYFETTM